MNELDLYLSNVCLEKIWNFLLIENEPDKDARSRQILGGFDENPSQSMMILFKRN